jgi:hypothetical protein
VALLETCANEGAREICERVTIAVSEYQVGQLNDDITVMTLERKPALRGPV